MVAGRSIRRRQVVANDGGDTPGFGDFAAPCERLPPLRSRPLGESVATTACPGEVIVVRYADDFVMGFQYQEDARAFLEALRNRLAKFSLELHPEKTRLIEFGRFAAERREKRGAGKPETFNFLGFTHGCGKTRKGAFTIKRKSIAKRLRAKLQELKVQLVRWMHRPVAEVGKWLRSVVQGWMNYHAVPGNIRSLDQFRTQTAPRGCTSYDGAVRRGESGPGSGSSA